MYMYDLNFLKEYNVQTFATNSKKFRRVPLSDYEVCCYTFGSHCCRFKCYDFHVVFFNGLYMQDEGKKTFFSKWALSFLKIVITIILEHKFVRWGGGREGEESVLMGLSACRN